MGLDEQTVSLTRAAQELRVRYGLAYSLVLTGTLEARQNPANGRWMVSRESLNRLLAQRGHADRKAASDG